MEQVAVELGRSCRPWRDSYEQELLDESPHWSRSKGDSVEDGLLSRSMLSLNAVRGRLQVSQRFLGLANIVIIGCLA